MTTNNLNDSVAYVEAKGLSKVWMAYADNCAGEDIMEVGFNPNSGCVYIALENGVCICSMMGQDVEYLVTDFNDGAEFFFDNYETAIKQMEALS
jgi:hypothetical protein